MKRHNTIASLLFIPLALGLMEVSSADSDIKLNMIAQEETVTLNSKGEQVITLTEPTSVVPGDMIVFTTHLHNTGKVTAENVAITNPIPKETLYVDGSAVTEKAAVTYSVDGGKRFDAPEKLTIVGSDGKKRPATANDYTHIRWILARVAPDAHDSVSFHAKVR